MRKLIESHKVRAGTATRSVRATSFAKVPGSVIHRFNRFDLEDHFDMERPRAVDLSLKATCDQFVHSYVFVLSFSEARRLDGVYVVSDRDKTHRLLKFGIEVLIREMRRVGADDLQKTAFRFDPVRSEWLNVASK